MLPLIYRVYAPYTAGSDNPQDPLYDSFIAGGVALPSIVLAAATQPLPLCQEDPSLEKFFTAFAAALLQPSLAGAPPPFNPPAFQFNSGGKILFIFFVH